MAMGISSRDPARVPVATASSGRDGGTSCRKREERRGVRWGAILIAGLHQVCQPDGPDRTAHGHASWFAGHLLRRSSHIAKWRLRLTALLAASHPALGDAAESASAAVVGARLKAPLQLVELMIPGWLLIGRFSIGHRLLVVESSGCPASRGAACQSGW